MEMINNNIDFDKALMNMTPEQITELEEKAKTYKQKSLDRRVADLENNKKQLKAEIDDLRNDISELIEDNKKLTVKVGDMQEDTDKVTKTLLTHGTERRELENLMHNIIYKEIKKGSIRDELFHGSLTKACKGHLNKSLGVSSFQWIEVKDIEIVKGLIVKFLNKVSIHNLMRKSTNSLRKEYEKSKMDNKKESISLGKARKFELFELLIDEIGGNEYEI